jgi:hypothetical protein
MRFPCLVLGMVLGGSALLLAQQVPPRDQPRAAAATGTARITGVILSDDPDPRPLRRATVTLGSAASLVGDSAMTNDDGTFAFEGLAAGRYTVRAEKPAYVAMAYGARRHGKPGTGILLRDGEAAHVTLRLPRGAVIAGMVADSDGQPVAGVQVAAMTYAYNEVSGERQVPVPLSGPQVRTDDRGMYRMFGLSAGDFAITAIAPPGPPRAYGLQRLSSADVRRALDQARSRMAVPARGESDGTPRNLMLAGVYYHGTTRAGEATRITLRAGEERTGVDIRLDYVPAASISGTVAGMPGRRTAVILALKGDNPYGVLTRSQATTHRTTAEARFSFSNIAPGTYLLLARGEGEFRAGEPPSELWAMAEVQVDGQDLAGIVLTAAPALSIAGRIEFDGTPPPPGAIPSFVRTPGAILGVHGSQPTPAVRIDEQRRFRIDGFLPGPLRLSTQLPGVRTPMRGWWLASAIADGRDLLDAPLDLQQSLDNVVVTFTQRASELSGRVAGATGTPVPQTYVVAFSADRSAWFFQSRRVAGVRTDDEGRYLIRNLPQGEYLLAVSDDLETNEWFDPAVLERLTAGAVRVSIRERETRTQDLTVR